MAERNTDYTDEDRELWENELRNEIYAANAMERLNSFTRIKWVYVHRKAEMLGIDRERVHRIVDAARAGFDWDRLVYDMERNGMARRAAEEVTERLAQGIMVNRILDRDLSDVRERNALVSSIIAIVAAISVAVSAWYYWECISSIVDSARQCLEHVI